MIVLGIESSCDETAVGIVKLEKGQGTILANRIASQENIHQNFGGVVPELAARAHIENLSPLVLEALAEAQLSLDDCDAIAATAGPGLIGGVMIGLVAGKAIAMVKNLPFFPINHLEAHALSVKLGTDLDYPFLLLLISGGHTALLSVLGLGKYHAWGKTRDDAVGEAFDKTARLLSPNQPLEVAGGVFIENLARQGKAHQFPLPKPFFGADHCDLSFAGLKTAVRRVVESPDFWQNTENPAHMAASFQETAALSLTERTARAMALHQKAYSLTKPLTLIAAGGVAANSLIRKKLTDLAESQGGKFYAPPPKLCTDNGVMVAWAGAEHLAAGRKGDLKAPPRARWALGEVEGDLRKGRKNRREG